MESPFHGRVALVTGGGSGIGRASSLAFANQGAAVIVSDVDVRGGEETVRMIAAASGQGTFVKCDVCDASEVEALIKSVIKIYGRLDFAHNNAGITGETALTSECTEKNWDRTMNINLKGVWLCMKSEIPQMLRLGRGAIVNTSSTQGLAATAMGMPAYAASKHGVIGLTKAAALEYATKNIRINAVCPGVTRTSMVTDFIDGDAEREALLIGRVPLGRMGRSGEIAEAVVWLCSDAASFVTGHAMSVDGGVNARM
jgi:NAD(P)-dependent dehydrogenase (short-subunit alcohol dehydrogenase family)